jgi:hypothetical protein
MGTTLLDDGSGGSRGNGDGAIEPGERLRLALTLANGGSQAAASAPAVLRLGQGMPAGCVTLIDSTAECGPIAEALDAALGGSVYRAALAAAVAALKDPGLVPSARMLAEMSERYRNSYVEFVMTRSLEHKRTLQSDPLPAEAEARFEKLARESIAKQREIEAADSVPFETYRQRYLSPESLQV